MSSPRSALFALVLLFLALACGSVPAQTPRTVPPPTEARPLGTSWTSCGFPANAKSDSGWARLRVYVAANGVAQRVEIQGDSERVFGDHAGDCAYKMPFRSAQSAPRKPIADWTPVFTVRFVR